MSIGTVFLLALVHIKFCRTTSGGLGGIMDGFPIKSLYF
jgi:hypothetical protein